MDALDLRALFASLRGEERRLRRPPPDGTGGILMAEGARLVVHAQQRGHHLNALLVSTKYNGPMPEGDHGVLTLEPDDIQRLTGFGEGTRPDGRACCLILLDRELVPVRPTPRRASSQTPRSLIWSFS